MRPDDRHGKGLDRTPLVSVRMPSFNHASFIEQALTSVLDDPYPNKEIVIVDDASTDDSDTVIRRWLSASGDRIPVKYFARKTNQGVARTINQALSHCSGEFIASLASDDYLLPGGILERVRYLQENPGKMAVFSDCIVVDGRSEMVAGSGLTGLYRANTGRFRTESGIRREFIRNWSVPGPVLMIRRGVFDIVGGYDERRIIEDWDFYLRMAARDLVGFTDGPVSAYRVHGGNYCMKPERMIVNFQEMRRILIKNFPLFRIRDKVSIIKKYVELTKALRAMRKEQRRSLGQHG